MGPITGRSGVTPPVVVSNRRLGSSVDAARQGAAPDEWKVWAKEPCAAPGV